MKHSIGSLLKYCKVMAVRSHSSLRELFHSHKFPHPGSQHSEGFAHCIFSTLGSPGVNMDKPRAINFQAQNCFIFVSVLHGILSCKCGLTA